MNGDHYPTDVMQKLVALCKRRGFVFQSSDIYGGLKSAYDYGPLGVELKRNIMNAWWATMVNGRDDVVGIDAAIIMKPDVWRASGHAAGFADPLVDCLVSKERFRADKAPRPAVGENLVLQVGDGNRAIAYGEQIAQRFGVSLQRQGNDLHGLYVADAQTVGCRHDADFSYPYRGYVSPCIGSPFLSDERQFNLMFRTALGAVDPMQDVAEVISSLTEADDLEAAVRERFARQAQEGPLADALASGQRQRIMRAVIELVTGPAMCYLRPETAQAMFVQFRNVLDATGLKPPFGIAQMGKSFRNEITVEHFIFRSCEFEQMEMEFFCPPGSQGEWMTYWKQERMTWWQRFANHPDDFRLRQHEADELAHYADECYDVEYYYPWGWDELEGIASRTDHDLHQHEEHAGVKLRYTDPDTVDPQTGKKPWSYRPFVIEPAAGATRAVLVYLLDAYHEETRTDAKGNPVVRTVLKLHPRLAPISCAVLPLVSNKEPFVVAARELHEALLAAGLRSRCDTKGAIGKRYAKHDEIGTPLCLTIDGQSLEDGTVTIRDRDSTDQDRIAIADAVAEVKRRIAGKS